jgi:hypothetical protein
LSCFYFYFWFRSWKLCLNLIGNRLAGRTAAARCTTNQQQADQRDRGLAAGSDQVARPSRCAISSVAALWFML